MMELARYIDHTLLRADAQKKDLDRLLMEAKEYRFAAVCVSPIRVSYAAARLAGTGVRVCTVVGFPQGATPTEVKVCEAKKAVADGAEEVDMVIPVGMLKDGETDYVQRDIPAVVGAVRGKARVKVIIECALLTDAEKRTACRLAKEAGADFVKTSTGYAAHGATVEDVRLMRAAVGDAMGVKAAGGIRTRADADAMIAAGATRIGTSCGVDIMG